MVKQGNKEDLIIKLNAVIFENKLTGQDLYDLCGFNQQALDDISERNYSNWCALDIEWTMEYLIDQIAERDNGKNKTMQTVQN